MAPILAEITSDLTIEFPIGGLCFVSLDNLRVSGDLFGRDDVGVTEEIVDRSLDRRQIELRPRDVRATSCPRPADRARIHLMKFTWFVRAICHVTFHPLLQATAS